MRSVGGIIFEKKGGMGLKVELSYGSRRVGRSERLGLAMREIG
jgi:hypothetical protein